jgi:hypothetical protein
MFCEGTEGLAGDEEENSSLIQFFQVFDSVDPETFTKGINLTN